MATYVARDTGKPGEDGPYSIVLVADNLPRAVLAGDLSSLEVERVAVRVARRVTEDRDVAVLFQPAHLDVVGDVAPEEIAADAVPGRAFGPEHLRVVVQPLDG